MSSRHGADADAGRMLPPDADHDAAAAGGRIPVEQAAARTVTPTDPYFDRGHVATDDPAFILQAVENTRQGNRSMRAARRAVAGESRSCARPRRR